MVEMAASYDMGWQRRGKWHNSSPGHGAVMGVTTGKVMDYATRCKNCRFCAQPKAKGKPPTTHDCRKNYEGSSKSMVFLLLVNFGIKLRYPTPDTQYTSARMIQPHYAKCRKRYLMELRSGLILPMRRGL